MKCHSVCVHGRSELSSSPWRACVCPLRARQQSWETLWWRVGPWDRASRLVGGHVLWSSEHPTGAWMTKKAHEGWTLTPIFLTKKSYCRTESCASRERVPVVGQLWPCRGKGGDRTWRTRCRAVHSWPLSNSEPSCEFPILTSPAFLRNATCWLHSRTTPVGTVTASGSLEGPCQAKANSWNDLSWLYHILRIRKCSGS